MANYFDYFYDYLGKMWGGRSYLSPDEVKYLMESEKAIEKRRGEMTETALESAARRGVLSSGITTDYLAKYVETPIETARQQLGLQKAQLVGAHRTQARGEAKEYALGKLASKQKLWGALGKLGGTALGFAAPHIGLGSFLEEGLPFASVLSSMLGGGDITDAMKQAIDWEKWLYPEETEEETEEEKVV